MYTRSFCSNLVINKREKVHFITPKTSPHTPASASTTAVNFSSDWKVSCSRWLFCLLKLLLCLSVYFPLALLFHVWQDVHFKFITPNTLRLVVRLRLHTHVYYLSQLAPCVSAGQCAKFSVIAVIWLGSVDRFAPTCWGLSLSFFASFHLFLSFHLYVLSHISQNVASFYRGITP